MSKCDQSIIKQFNAFKVLTPSQLLQISETAIHKAFNKDDILFREGEHLKGLYCIIKGACKMSKLSKNGRDQIVTLINKGDLMGQRSLLINQPSNLTAVAITDVEVCFVPKLEFINSINSNNIFLIEMLKNISNKLKNIDNSIVNLAQKSVKKRLAETLIFISEKFGVNNDGFLNLVLSREDYANIIGTATESTIRILSSFKKEGYITTSGKHIKIENIEKLSKIV